MSPKRQSVPKVSTTLTPQEAQERIAQNIALGKEIAFMKGVYGPEWECLYRVGMNESGWKDWATNTESGAYGIPQSLPAKKLDTYGDRHDPSVQIRWMIDYVFERYGSPCQALAFWNANKWY